MPDAYDVAPLIPGYRDLHLLSRGSTAEVYRAVQERLNRLVAIKVLRLDDLTTIDQVEHELATAVRLSQHPHIVSIIDTGFVAGRPYLVMEFCEEGSYAQILARRGPLSVPEAMDVAIKVADALQAAHSIGFIHRDVKPANILRSRFGPALTDFGIARRPAELSGTVTLNKLTPYHAAPEALRREPQSAASDVYSLGSTLWNLLAGYPPFASPGEQEPDPFEYREKVLTRTAPLIPRPDVPVWLQSEISRAMAKTPESRHPSAAAFAEALRRGWAQWTGQPWTSPTAYPPLEPTAPPDGAGGQGAGRQEPQGQGPHPDAPASQEAPSGGAGTAPPAPSPGPTAPPPWPPLPAPASPALSGVPGPVTGPAEPPPPESPWASPTSRPIAESLAVSTPASPLASSTPSTAAPSAPPSAPSPGPLSTPVPGPVEPDTSTPRPASPAPLSMASPPRERTTGHQDELERVPLGESDERPRRVTLWPFLVAAITGVILAIAVLVVFRFPFLGDPGGNGDDEAAPSPTASVEVGPGPEPGLSVDPEANPQASVNPAVAPSDVQLEDHTTSVTLSWTDNSDGRGIYYIVGAPEGSDPRVMTEAAPGITQVTLEALNPTVNYCFTVVVIISVDEVAFSEQTCTDR